MKTEIVLITPEMAKKLVSANKKNRPHNKRRSKAFAEAMKRSEWEENGDTIRIAETGRLLDGQHRLWAIIYSGIPQRYIVVSGLKEEVFDTIDRGSTRTIGDILSMRGEKHYNALAAAARLLVVYDKTGNPFNGNPEVSPTAREVEDFIDSSPDIKRAVEMSIHSRWIRKYMTPALAAMCRFIFWQVSIEETDDFFEQLETGVVDDAQAPALLLRDRLMEDKASKERMSKRYAAALIFKAFALHRSGEKRRFLRVRQQGDAPETDLFSIEKLKEVA